MTAETVLITGAARRVGAELARSLHADGMNVVIHYHRSAREAETLCDELNRARPGSAALVCADLLEPGSFGVIVDTARSLAGRLDVLVNNASAFYQTPVESTTHAQWEEIMGTNLKAPYFLAQHAAPLLRERRGCIVNICDIHAIRPLRLYPVYSIAKAGLGMLTKALAKELAPEVRVNAVAPGAVLWPETMDEALRERILSHTMLKRPGTPAEVVKAVKFLIRDAGYMTGQTLTVDGGRTLYS
jgi:pteridine reductase